MNFLYQIFVMERNRGELDVSKTKSIMYSKKVFLTLIESILGRKINSCGST